MVYGIEKFKEYFSNYTGQYVFIGGTACDILLDEIGVSFRATKDLDMVLIIEVLDESLDLSFGNLSKTVAMNTDKRVRKRAVLSFCTTK